MGGKKHIQARFGQSEMDKMKEIDTTHVLNKVKWTKTKTQLTVHILIKVKWTQKDTNTSTF